MWPLSSRGGGALKKELVCCFPYHELLGRACEPPRTEAHGHQKVHLRGT